MSRVLQGLGRRSAGKLFVNLQAYGGKVYTSAVTAPGAGALPWDDTACAALGEHTHSGMLGCRVQAEAAEEWNRTAPERWRRLHRRAYQKALRVHGRGSVVLVTRVWEIQTRGVLHVHPVVGCESALEMAGAWEYLRCLAELAPKYGFGFVHSREDKVRRMPAENAAAYLSSYFVKGRAKKAALWESVTSEAMPRSIIHVSVRLTQETRCTMRNLRLRRALWVVWRAQPTLEETHVVGQILEVFRGGTELLGVWDEVRGPPGESDRVWA